MTQILHTHLLVSLTPGGPSGRFKTACGKEGMPLTYQHSFNANGDFFEGKRPRSAGCGIKAVREIRFGVPDRSVRYCERCMKHWQKGAGI